MTPAVLACPGNQAGEAVTSASFARLLSAQFDWLVTVDPHLHRRRSLGEIYSIPAEVVHEKTRRGDEDAAIATIQSDAFRTDRAPALVDDIISSARTMIEAARQWRAAGSAAPICLGVHGVFAAGAYEALQEAGVADIVTTNSILHASNGIDLAGVLAESIERAWRQVDGRGPTQKSGG